MGTAKYPTQSLWQEGAEPAIEVANVVALCQHYFF